MVFEETHAAQIDLSALSTGDLIEDRYSYIEKIGKGAFGTVILVEDTVVDERLILKFLNPNVTAACGCGESFSVDAAGKLTVAGVTKDVAFPVEGKLVSDGKMTFAGAYKLNMTEYDMEPPSAMFGQIVTGEEVEIKFELVVIK